MKHKCRFRRGSEIGLNAINITDNRWTRLRRFIKQITLAAPDHHRIYRYLKSRAAVRKENRLLLERHPYVIHPMSKFREYWDVLMFFCLCIHLTIAPFVVAFFDEITTFNIAPITWCDSFLSAMLYIEIVLKFFTGYLVHQSSRVELDKRQILKHYVRGTFLLDLFGSAPYIGIMDVIIPNINVGASFLQFSEDKDMSVVVHCVSFLYLCNIFRYRQIRYYFSGIPALCNFSDKTATYLKFSIFIFFFIHWSACLQIYVPNFVDVVLGDSPIHHSRMQPRIKTFIDMLRIYLTEVVITLRLALHCGHSTSSEANGIRLTLTTIISSLGWFIFGFCTMMTFRMMLSSEESRIQYEVVYNELREHASDLPHELREKIKLYYAHKYKGHFFNEWLITRIFSKPLRQDILMHTCHLLVSKVRLFVDLEKSITQEIVRYLTLEIFLEGDVIVIGETHGDSMFIIATGTVAVYAHDGNEICHLHDGDHFGEISLLTMDQKRTATVIAVETCEMYRLDRRDFDKLSEKYPDLYDMMQLLAVDRMRRPTRHRASVRYRSIEKQ